MKIRVYYSTTQLCIVQRDLHFILLLIRFLPNAPIYSIMHQSYNHITTYTKTYTDIYVVIILLMSDNLSFYLQLFHLTHTNNVYILFEYIFPYIIYMKI